MENKRALTKGQFMAAWINTEDYDFMKEPGVFHARLDHKFWNRRHLVNFFTLSDGRKVIAATFPEANYQGLADIPVGTNVILTFEKRGKNQKVYIRKVVQETVCP